jgi:PKD repeat protein
MKKLYLSLLICFATYNLSNAQCSANFEASKNPVCVGEEVYFTNLTDGVITSYVWDFGVGATPATFIGENPPNVTYSSSGTKNISLTVQCFSPSPSNCVTIGGITIGGIVIGGVTTCVAAPAALSISTRITSITVKDVPVPAFTSSPGAITCSSTPVDFTYTGTAATSYSWSFGAGATPGNSAAKDPQDVIYGSAGSKTVSITASNGACSGTASQVLTVTGPTASFTTSAPACTNQGVNFTNTGATGGNWKYSWDFGGSSNPATSTAESPKGVLYSTAGAKTVSFTVYDGSCSATTTSPITINQSPTASFVSTAPACTNQPIDFSNTGTKSVTYAWDFGGATTNTSTNENPTGVLYTTAGGKVVTLTVTQGSCSTSIAQGITIYASPTATIVSPASACTKANVDFASTGSSTGPNWRYSWDFGAGATPSGSSSDTPKGIVYSTAGTKTITLTVYDKNCSTTTTKTISINQTPTANFISSAPACTGEPVNFFNTGTITGVTWAWDFGGGVPATSTTQDQAGVTYATAGGKKIQLITKTATCADTSKQAITIYQSPTATFDAPASVCTNTKMNFTNTGSTGAMWVYSWDFGAGAEPHTSTAENPKGIYYTTSGSKTITLTISDEHCSKSTTQTLIIKATPTAGFSNSAPQCTGLPVDFVNLGSTGAGLSWAWDFDKGGSASAAPATDATETPKGVKYSSSGNKVVQQIVTNSGTSCSDTSIQSITIHPTPAVTFTISPTTVCVGDAVKFTNTTNTTGYPSSNWSYHWDFGKDALPQSSTSENTEGVAYYTGGVVKEVKTVSLSVSNGYCTSIATNTLTINALPVANAGRDTTICANTTVQIGKTAVAGNTYSWFAPVTLSSGTVANPIATPIAHITQYIVTVKNTATTCKNRDTIMVTMLDPIKVDAGVDETICRYDSVQVGVGLVEQQLYSWTPIAGLTDPTIPNPISSPDSTTTYTVTVTYKGKACKAETDEVMITVHQLPYIEAGTVRYQPRPNDSIIIMDSITLGASVQLIAIGGVQYNWTPAYKLDNVGIYNPYASPDTTTRYTVTGTEFTVV